MKKLVLIILFLILISCGKRDNYFLVRPDGSRIHVSVIGFNDRDNGIKFIQVNGGYKYTKDEIIK